jgi:CheY-like chemotaxis protein
VAWQAQRRHEASTRPQVTAVPTTTAALHLLKEQQARDGAPGFDLILKDHDPPAANACRLLRRLVEDETLKTVPIGACGAAVPARCPSRKLARS